MSARGMHDLSVVIPTLNEAATLPLLLQDLKAQSGCRLEVIVADGGSDDGTQDLASGARICTAPRGRGAQMNAGARLAQGRDLLFLHADTRLPGDPRFLAAALEALKEKRRETGNGRVAGHFALRFDRKEGNHEAIYLLLEAKSALNRRGTINGDQGLLLEHDYFRELGGFDERRTFLEDQSIASRIFETGRWILLPGELHTSARRFEAEGVHQRLALMALLMGAYASGFDAFLDAAPDLYTTQDRATHLRLAPFYRRCRRMLREQGIRGMLRILYLAGRYVRENCWQLFWWRDHRRLGRDSAGRHPSLDVFDARLAWLLDNPVGNVLGALLVSLWLFVWLPLTENRTP